MEIRLHCDAKVEHGLQRLATSARWVSLLDTSSGIARSFKCDTSNRRTLQDWEQGRRAPSGAARTLLLVVAKNPRALLDVA